MKRIVIRVALGFGVLLMLSGCEEYEGVDYLNIGHPADPVAASGQRARMSGALVSENINVSPQLGSIGSSAARMQTTAPTMDHSTMDHSKMKQPKAKKPAMAPTMMHRGSHQ